MAEVVATLRERIATKQHNQLMQMHVRKLSVYAPSAFLRIVMAAPPSKPGERFNDWESIDLDPDTLDEPITLDDVEAWLQRKGTNESLVGWMTSVLHRDSDKPFPFESYIECVRKHQPSAFNRALFHQVPTSSPRYRRLVEANADAVVDALLLSKHLNLHYIGDALPTEALGRVITELAKRDQALSFSDLRMYRRAYESAPDAYVELLTRAIHKVNKDNVWSIGMPKDLPAEAIQAVLDQVKGKEAEFARVAGQSMIYSKQAATALAHFLGHAKRGKLVARLLAVGGKEGRRAAAAQRDAQAKKKTKTAERVRELVATIEKIPESRAWLAPIANQPSGWNLDATQWLLDEPEGGDKPAHEPTSVDVLRQALEDDVHDAEDLEPHQWADLLQVVTIGGWKEDLEWAVARANELGWLGWGNDEAKLWQAVERYDLGQYVSIRHTHGDKPMGLMHLLIGAEAPLAIIRHAFACFAEGRGNLTMGYSQRNFSDALNQWDVDERIELGLITQHLDLVRHHRISPNELDRYDTLEEATDAGTSWTSAASHLGFRFRAMVRGGTKTTLRMREGIELGLDHETYRWWQKGLNGGDDGQTSLMGDVQVFQLDIESVGPKLRYAVNGTLVASGPQGHLYEGVPEHAGPVVVETDGAIESVRLTEMLPMGEANDLANLLWSEDEAAVRDLQDTKGEPAAHGLAIAALLSDNESLAAASREALSTLGEVAQPYLEALGLSAKKAEAAGFQVRSFQACCDAFAASDPKKKLVVTDDVRYLKMGASFGKPSDPGWSDGVAEDTIYLTDDEGLLNDVQNLPQTSMPALCVWNKKGDGHWAGEVGKYLILTASFWPEEYDDYGEYFDLTLAAWKVEEGVALAAWKGDRKVLESVMGIPWPTKRSWQSAGEVWIGE